jgi:hypothetical protein
LADEISKVNEYLDGRQFTEDEITRGPISTRVHYDRDENGKQPEKS